MLLRTVISCGDCGTIWLHGCPVCKTPTRIIEDGIYPAVKKKVKKVEVKPKIRKIKIYQPLPITIDNFFIATTGDFKEIRKVPFGFASFFKSKGSEYYKNEDGSKLIRVSDHWGAGIKYCNWFLIGYKYMHVGKFQKVYGKDFRIGIIDITDLKDNI